MSNPTSNFEKWRAYTSHLPSPDSFVNWGFYYLIAAALQRRVWCPPDWRRLYPNIYITLVGRPGVGKGQVIKSVSEVLNYHTLESVKPQPKDNINIQAVVDATHTIDLKEAKEESKEAPKMIVVAADCVTYEALVQSMGRCVRRINATKFNVEKQVLEPFVYSHSSLCFCLEELESLLREKTQALRTFLIQAYDCNDNYEYRTKNAGTDRLRRLCLNFFAATNPDFMQSTFDDRLLSSGYASRTFFIYAAKNRKTVSVMSELTAEQEVYKKEIAEHVKKLYSLYGQVQFEPGVLEYFQAFMVDFEKNPDSSHSVKLEHFKSRMNIHVMKLAMCLHFGESTDMTISLATFKRAIDIILAEMKTMHLALTMNNKNPLADPSSKVAAYLKATGEKKFNELLAEFWGDIDNKQLQAVLDHLELMGEVTSGMKQCPVAQKQMMFYGAIKSKEPVLT